MSNLILLVICFVFGALLRRGGHLPETAPAVLNAFIIHVSLPALVLLHVHDLRWSSDFGLAAGMAWLQFGLAAAFFAVLGRWLALPRKTIGALILTGGLGNTSFLGFPMIEAFYGKGALAVGIIADQLGSFMVLSTLGIIVAACYAGTGASARDIGKRVFLFPPFLALLLALTLRQAVYPDWLIATFNRLGDTLAPLALVSVGFQLRLGHLAGNGRKLALGLVFKLLLAPLVLFFLFVPLLGARGMTAQVTLFEAAMPPMITAAIIAIEHDLDPDLANLMVALGIMLSFFTLTGWWWVLRGV